MFLYTYYLIISPWDIIYYLYINKILEQHINIEKNIFCLDCCYSNIQKYHCLQLKYLRNTQKYHCLQESICAILRNTIVCKKVFAQYSEIPLFARRKYLCNIQKYHCFQEKYLRNTLKWYCVVLDAWLESRG